VAESATLTVENATWVPFRAVTRRRVALVGVYVASVAGLLLACTTKSDSPTVGAAGASTTTAATPTTPTTAGTTTTTVPPRRGSGNAVVLAFAGDTNFEGVIRARLDADPDTVLREVAPTFTAADLAMVNLETAITDGGTAQSKDFTFRAPPAGLDALRAAGIDVVTEANNHGMDFGPQGLQDSLAARTAKQFPVIGIGQDIDDAFTPYKTTIKGQRITIIAATQVLDSSLIDSWTAGPGKPGLASAKLVDRLVAEVQKARADSDTVVVYLHWGIEKTTCPSGDQSSIATTLVNAGADIVVGSHAHRLLGAGRMGQAFVDYGLGNFAFYAGSPDGARTGILELTVTGRDIDSYTWLPGHIDDRVPSLLDDAAATDALSYWNSLRDCTGLTP
jgi:poly-gamma-glutamate synthesis protein (capsule biosynthesis protein)